MKFKENYFYSTISYASEYTLKNLIAEKAKILAELKEKDLFLKDFDKNPKFILENYEKALRLFEEVEVFFKKYITIKKHFEPGFFKKKEKIDLSIPNEILNKLEQKFKLAYTALYDAYEKNYNVITKGLYTKITFKHYKLSPTGDHYNVRKILSVEEEEKTVPKHLGQDKIHAMGVRKNVDGMFEIIPPGLNQFNVTQAEESEYFFVRKKDGLDYSAGEKYFYKKIFTDNAINVLSKITKAIHNSSWHNKKKFGGPFCYMAIPKKKFYIDLFKEEEVIRNKQLR